MLERHDDEEASTGHGEAADPGQAGCRQPDGRRGASDGCQGLFARERVPAPGLEAVHELGEEGFSYHMQKVSLRDALRMPVPG